MEPFRKIGAGLALGILLLTLTMLGIFHLEETYSSQVKTIEGPQNLTIESQKLSSNSFSVAPYDTQEVFISEEQSPGFAFTSVGGSWEETKPEGTNVDVQVRFKSDDGWSEWLDLEEEDDIFQENTAGENATRRYAMASSNGSTAIQYKVLMYGDGINIPAVSNMDWTFIKAAKTIPRSETPQPQYSSNVAISASTYIALNSTKKNVITRLEWGADESYRYLSSNDIDPVLIDLDEDYYEIHEDELGYSRVVTEDANGDKYKWPLQYPTDVKKFIIHHTATTSNLDSPTQAIRDIYYYHAITRGWGDIGYNFLVDQDGNVYEGRYGGEGVIGAHAGPGNNGSVGIAILGNFEENEVSELIVGSVSQLVAQKSKVHDIEPDGFSAFRSQLMPNVFGHKDIMSTQCPGINLYQKLPIIRALAKELKNNEKEKFVIDYDYIDLSEIYYIEMKPRDSMEVTMEMENIGKVDWDSSTFIVLNKNEDLNDFVSFPNTQDGILAYQEEQLVAPGEMATFKFTIESEKIADIKYMEITPVINSIHKPFDSVTIPISVQQVDYKYSFVDSKYPEKTMEQGQEFNGWIQLKNVGNITWQKSGENTVALGTDHERDRISQFVSTGGQIMGYLEEDEVAPGEIGTFNLNLKAPDEAGYYKEYFTPRLVGEDTWMADSGLYFETTVFGDLYEAEHTETLATEQWKKGKQYLVIMKIRNIGQSDWTDENFTIGFASDKDLEVSSAKLENDEDVKPGDIATLTFVTEVLETETAGIKPLLVVPMVNDIRLMDRPVYHFYVAADNNDPTPEETVAKLKANLANLEKEKEEAIQEGDGDVQSGSGNQEEIRVKISSFSGNPEITANGDFDIYSGDTFITSQIANQTAKVIYSDGKYQVTTSTNSYKNSEEIRFVPKDGAILRVENFDHNPAWNLTLNDNKYRGILEVQYIDDQLTLINELPLEDYLKGLGEVSDSALTEKIKTIMVAARSYALFYITIDEKFPGKPYHLDDDPNVSQKYLGYGFEERAPNVASAVAATKGQVVTYDGEVVKTPYFNQSDGTETKAAEDVWAWSEPYLVPVSDIYCDGDEFLGHGVGLSGCGATGMAEENYNYIEILQHYYTGVQITDLY